MFCTASYNARRQRVLAGETPNQRAARTADKWPKSNYVAMLLAAPERQPVASCMENTL
jgi:hypothetical protein